MTTSTNTPTFIDHCVIGAGFQGLPILKKLTEMGERVICLDKNEDVGGIWHTGAYETAHIISSRYATGFPDFPMPDSYPDFPSKREMQRYFRSYAEHFNLLPHIRFGAAVTRIRPASAQETARGARWRTECSDGSTVLSRTVVIANGHHTKPNLASYPGEWAGEMMHSDAYRTSEVFKGKRVLIVGNGNTACDAAVEASLHGVGADISVREGVYFFPRTFMGKPLDTFLKAIPFDAPWLERLFGWIVHKVAVGDPARYGMPKPTFRIFDRHPVINSELLRRIKLGRIGVRPEIARHDGNTVTFADGTSRQYDLIFWAIGYQMAFPMLAPEDDLLDWEGGKPVMFLQTALPKARGLFIAGLGQARTGGGPLFQIGGYLTARMAAFDARGATGLIEAIAATSRMQFLEWAFGFKPVAPADTRSLSLQHHLASARELTKLLDAIGAPDAKAARGLSKARSNLDLGQAAARMVTS
jgi:cation diffusion facilitator CzcD-associated flavoprotein CzcO